MEINGKSKRDTKRIGDISEGAIIIRFLQRGYTILTPYGRNQRYDLIVEDTQRKFWRVQCKSARVNEGKTMITFSTANRNVTGKNRQPRDYRGQCDYFAAYCAELNKAYLIPVDRVGARTASLLLATASNRKKNMLSAEDYEL